MRCHNRDFKIGKKPAMFILTYGELCTCGVYVLLATLSDVNYNVRFWLLCRNIYRVEMMFKLNDEKLLIICDL